ncbi:recombination mediator RecR [Galenea microaerophila]
MEQSPLVQQLIEAFSALPGIGPKSAQRISYALLERNRTAGLQLAQALEQAMKQVGHCEQCRTFSEAPLCTICQNPKRQNGQLCIVESPADILAIEQSGSYQGQYFVLMGHLSPIDGIGPEALGLDKLEHRLQQASADEAIEELILATNPTVEGEVTAHYIHQMAQRLQLTVTRLAQGIPMGGELEYVDSGTLSQAFAGRKPL